MRLRNQDVVVSLPRRKRPRNQTSTMTELVSLVVQSKKALQQAEATCSATNHVSRRTSDLVLNVIAAEAKLKWLSDGVLDQLDVRFAKHCGTKTLKLK